jgi:hypothetical protein
MMGGARHAHSRLMTPRVALVMLAALVLACSGKTTLLGRTDDGSEQDGGQPSLDDAAISARDAAADGAAQPVGCSSATLSPCDESEYCAASEPFSCGAGTCTMRPPPPPPSCDGIECGCDGKLRCAGYAPAEGWDIGSTQCTLPCGPSLICDAVTTFCLHTITSQQGETWECLGIPQSCSIDRSCACIQPTVDAAGDCAGDDQKVTVHRTIN